MFVGDLSDRGGKWVEVVEFVGGAVEDGGVGYVGGNDWKKV